jgi:hypothetical protein
MKRTTTWRKYATLYKSHFLCDTFYVTLYNIHVALFILHFLSQLSVLLSICHLKFLYSIFHYHFLSHMTARYCFHFEDLSLLHISPPLTVSTVGLLPASQRAADRNNAQRVRTTVLLSQWRSDFLQTHRRGYLGAYLHEFYI